MKRVRKILSILLAIVLLLVVVAVAAGTWMVRRSWTQTAGTLTAPGLSAQVEIIRDQWGVPHISAANEPDMFFAQGFVHAQDRLWQMEFGRRLGSGTLSAVMGDSALDIDRYMRTYGLRRAAQRDWDQLDADSRAALQHYADGINAFLDTHGGQLPVEFTIFRYAPSHWEPLDTLTWGKLMSMNLAGDYGLDLVRAQIVAKYGPDRTKEILPLPDASSASVSELDGFAWMRDQPTPRSVGLLGNLKRPILLQGSNSWVVHGSRTDTGKPYLADDTHLALNMPAIWYQNHLQGGRFNVTGFSLPGIPLVLIGHNTRISWGATNLSYDIQDLYVERLNDAQNPTQYEFEGTWRDLEIITETIDVKDAAPVELTVRLTHHGPIINDVEPLLEEGEPLTIRWPDLDGSPLFRAVIGLNLAGNWQEFRDALRDWGAPKQNFVYADVDGNIGFQSVSHVPIRARGHQGTLPIPGWTGEYEWQGFIPFDDLPTHYNPPEGFIIAANSRVSPPDKGKYPLEYFGVASYRAQQLTQMLTADDHVTRDDIRNMQGTTASMQAQVMLPYLLATKPETPAEQQALDLLKSWDLRYETDRVGASIFEVWYWSFQRSLLKDELGDDLMFEYLRYGLATSIRLNLLMQNPQSTWFDDITTPQVETRDEIVRKSLDEALAWLNEHNGSDPKGWTWGQLHTMTFVHQPLGTLGIPVLDSMFNSGPVPARGGDFTINNAWYSVIEPFEMEGGTTQRIIVDLSDMERSQAVLATGQTEQIFSPHRSDQTEMWENLEYYPMLFSREQIGAASHETLTLTP